MWPWDQWQHRHCDCHRCRPQRWTWTTTTNTLEWGVRRCATWAEAIKFARRIDTQTKPRVTREHGQWVVRYTPRFIVSHNTAVA